MKIITQEEYQDKVKVGTVLVDFSELICQPCAFLKEFLVQLEDSFPTIDFYEVICEENKELTKEMRIISVPTLFIYKDGKPIKVIYGLQTKEALERVLSQYGEKKTAT